LNTGNEGTLEIAVTEVARLDVVVASHAGRSRGQAQAAIADGAVYVDGKRVREAGLKVQPGQQVRVEPPAPSQRRQIDGGGLQIVHRDARILVVAKPAGLPTQPPPRGGDALSLRVQKLLGPQAYLGEVHRLDRDASGLVVYALDRQAAGELSRQFRDHHAGRRYLALVRSSRAVPAMRIDEPLAEVGPGRMTTAATGVPACSEVQPLGFRADQQRALLEVALRTGRSHQIRVHLAWGVGPIVGDGQYGDPEGPYPQDGATRRIALHGAWLGLYHPETGKRVSWVCPPPEDFWPDGAAWPEAAAWIEGAPTGPQRRPAVAAVA
jgi:23S rRNA pseudouridine1911/1915/1917 synthase